MTQLLQDIFIVENLQILSEGKNSNTMRIKGVFGRCNEKNNNGRIYPTAVLESQLKKVQPLISERRLCGELDHPQNDTVKLSNASHLITKLEMKGNDLVGEAEILRTPAGLTAKALIEGGVKIGISSRGMGTLSEDAQGNKIVNEDFRLVTFDLVADPSTRGAFPGLSESTESRFVQQSQSKLKKEQNFVTMLQSKLREAYDPWIEEAKTKKKVKKDMPGNKEALDTDGDGKIEGSDLAALRAKKKGMMEAVKAEGSWHRIAYVIEQNRWTSRKPGVDPEDAQARRESDTQHEAPFDKRGKAHVKRREDRLAQRSALGRKEKPKVENTIYTYANIAYTLAEAFADELDKTTVARADSEGDTKAPSFMDRRRVAAGKKSAAKADVKAAAIRQKGQIKLARSMDKAKAAAAAGKPVTGGEKAAAIAGKAAGAVAAAAKKAPGAIKGAAEKTTGAIKGAAEKTTQAAEKFGERLGKAKVRGKQQQQAKSNIASREKAKVSANLAKASEEEKAKKVRPPGTFGAGVPYGEALSYKMIGLYLAEAFGLVSEEDNPLRTARKTAASNERVKRNEAAYNKTGRAPKDATARLDPEGKRLPGKRAIK